MTRRGQTAEGLPRRAVVPDSGGLWLQGNLGWWKEVEEVQASASDNVFSILSYWV